MELTAKAFLDALAVGESGGRYDILYGGGKFTDFSGFPQWEGKDNSHAAGRYQFEPATWREVAGKLGLLDFSPESQDIGAWWLACHVYGDHTGRDLPSDLVAGNLADVALALHSTWTSLGASFPNRYRAALAKLGVPSQPQPAPVPVPAPVPQKPQPHAGVIAGAAGGVAGALALNMAWLLSLAHVAVPDNIQASWVVLIGAGGGYLLHRVMAAVPKGAPA